jgi:formylglycine-generating enzyme required for sulfatase activity
MVRVPAGTFVMGTDDPDAMMNERPAREVTVDAFLLDIDPVTNAAFARFVEETGYVTTAEKPVDWDELKKQAPHGTPRPPEEALQPGALVFTPPDADRRVDLRDMSQWWTWVNGADWRHPEGPESDIAGRGDHPVVQIGWEDAQAYAAWSGKRLPSEAEWEYAARGGSNGTRFAWGNTFRPDGRYMANTFTGDFPGTNTADDGFTGTSPVGSFPANGFGLNDMAGNVWNWTADIYVDQPRNAAAIRATLNLPPALRTRVIKGGSFLCHTDYCESYRPEARRNLPADTGSAHVGFRCALDIE